jgi:GTPase SAR1 family protein
MATTTGTVSGSGSYNFKVVLLGEGCVGKTSVVLRYVEDKFNEKHITTLQVSFFIDIFFVCKMCILYYNCTMRKNIFCLYS